MMPSYPGVAKNVLILHNPGLVHGIVELLYKDKVHKNLQLLLYKLVLCCESCQIFQTLQIIYNFSLADPHSESGRNIYDLVCDGLRYLDTRTDFWRQQKPMYARKRDKMMQRAKFVPGGDDNINQYIIKELEKIDEGKENMLIFYPDCTRTKDRFHFESSLQLSKLSLGFLM